MRCAVKISLSVEKDEAESVSIQCSVAGLPENEAKTKWSELLAMVAKLLEIEEPATTPIRRGVVF
jgi:hypothetical protein